TSNAILEQEVASSQTSFLVTLLFYFISGVGTYPFAFYVYYRILTIRKFRKSSAFRLIVSNGFMGFTAAFSFAIMCHVT
ncbi:hypothetical protein PFISCL1PPCAC_6443, partial [Pristionchus fissidentatus]